MSRFQPPTVSSISNARSIAIFYVIWIHVGITILTLAFELRDQGLSKWGIPLSFISLQDGVHKASLLKDMPCSILSSSWTIGLNKNRLRIRDFWSWFEGYLHYCRQLIAWGSWLGSWVLGNRSVHPRTLWQSSVSLNSLSTSSHPHGELAC